MRQELRWLCVTSIVSVLGIQAVGAEPSPHSHELARPATSVAEWIAQLEADCILATAVKVNPLNPIDVAQKTLSTEPEEEELTVTGERKTDGYQVPNTSTGTKTDTPLRDIPQSIQVVPKAVLRDQQVNRLDDALRNVAGVNQSFNFGPFTFYSIRGFDATETNLLRDGLIDTLAGQVSELSSVGTRSRVSVFSVA